jgi:hypothetical protein
MANSWLRWGLVTGSALSLAGCVEMAMVQVLDDGKSDDSGDVALDCGDYECEETYDESGSDTVDAYDTGDYTSQSVQVTNSTLSGDMGEVQGFSDESPMNSGYSYDGYASVEIHATGTNGTDAAMAIVEISGGLDHPNLQPGAHFHFDAGDYAYGSYDQPLSMDVVGCSGPAEGNWVFDTLADGVDVDVSQGNQTGNIAIDFTATFTAYDDMGDTHLQEVVGSFETPAALHQ